MTRNVTADEIGCSKVENKWKCLAGHYDSEKKKFVGKTLGIYDKVTNRRFQTIIKGDSIRILLHGKRRVCIDYAYEEDGERILELLCK